MKSPGLILTFAAALSVASVSPVFAHAVPATPAGAPSGSSETTVVLSPFEVNTTSDVGYTATNTLAGSRLNAALKDTPAIIDVFTKEFLNDLGATSLQDAMVYANNSQTDDGDTERVNAGAAATGASNPYRFRSRGILGSSTRNYFETRLATNLYNTERLDDSRGPNSVLFGIGSAGGTLNNQPKRPMFGPRFTELGLQTGTENWGRVTLDHNEPVVTNTFGLRLNAMFEDRNHWREHLGNRKRAVNLAATYRPFRRTEIRFDAERGDGRGTVGRNLPGQDGITRWWNQGQPVVNSVATTAPTAADTARGLQRPLTASRLVYVENQNFLVDVRNFWSTLPDTPYNTSILNDPARVPYEANGAGPGGRTGHDFNNETVIVEHRFTRDLVGEVGYYHELGTYETFDLDSSFPLVRGDPDGLLRNPATFVSLDGYRPATDAAGNFINPNAGRTYYETAWQRRRARNESDNLRATLAYQSDFGRWGRHQFAALGQRQVEKVLSGTEREVWLGAPFNNDPANLNNGVWRRAYVTLGDAASQRVPDPLARPNLTVSYPGRATPLTNGWVPSGAGNKSTRTIESAMLATQNYWFGGRVVTTAGFREDRLTQQRTNAVRDTSGVWAGTQGIQVFNAASTTDTFTFTGRTSTAGIVVHPWSVVSVFANTSKNVGLPSFTQRLGPDGAAPPPPEGKGFDAGLTLSFNRDRIVARLSYFTTDSLNQTTGMGVDNAFTPAYNNLMSILDDPNGDGSTADRLYTPAQLAKYSELRPRAIANGDSVDNTNEGYEFRVTANVGDSLRFIVNYSYNLQERANVYKRTVPLFQQLEALLADLQAANPGINVGEQRGTQGQTFAALLANTVADLEGRKLDFEGAYGNRKHKANFFANYTFRSTALRGWSAGLGGRYLSPIFAGRVTTAPGTPPINAGSTTGVGIAGAEVYGSDSLLFDGMLRYATRATWFGRNVRASFQLNVRNLRDDHDIEIRRYKSDGVTLDRFFLTTPREIVLSSTFRF